MSPFHSRHLNLNFISIYSNESDIARYFSISPQGAVSTLVLIDQHLVFDHRTGIWEQSCLGVRVMMLASFKIVLRFHGHD